MLTKHLYILYVDGTPHATNFRYSCKKAMDTYAHTKPWFGIEQEYMFMDPETNRPYGWPRNGYPEPQEIDRKKKLD